MISLSRLFRGKKWNLLRGRVDTLPDGRDHRFFMGTILFSILLFLFPTTALYYAIFTALRLVILSVQTGLTLTRQTVTTTPWFSLIARCLYPFSSLACVKFTWFDEDCEKRNMHRLGAPLNVLSNRVNAHLVAKSYCEVWRENVPVEVNPTEIPKKHNSLSSVFTAVLCGDLIKS